MRRGMDGQNWRRFKRIAFVLKEKPRPDYFQVYLCSLKMSFVMLGSILVYVARILKEAVALWSLQLIIKGKNNNRFT